MSANNKYLIIGSAPYISEWYRRYQPYFRGYRVIPLNNAIRVVDPSHVYIHFRSCNHKEFMKTHHKEVSLSEDHSGHIFETMRYPGMYKSDSYKGTTLIDTLISLLWMHQYKPIEVHVAGCDYQYSGPKTHFYKSKGTLDPLEQGTGTLVRELKHVQQLYEQHGSRVFNAGGQLSSLLPFERSLE